MVAVKPHSHTWQARLAGLERAILAFIVENGALDHAGAAGTITEVHIELLLVVGDRDRGLVRRGDAIEIVGGHMIRRCRDSHDIGAALETGKVVFPICSRGARLEQRGAIAGKKLHLHARQRLIRRIHHAIGIPIAENKVANAGSTDRHRSQSTGGHHLAAIFISELVRISAGRLRGADAALEGDRQRFAGIDARPHGEDRFRGVA